MIETVNLINLLSEKEELEKRINSLVYGSIEIREKNDNKYIYIHRRENYRTITKYIDVYSDELYNLILNNNILVKEYKKSLNNINKELKLLNYIDTYLDDDIKLNIDLAKKFLLDNIYSQAVLEGISATYMDTEKIINGAKVNNLKVDDIMKIVNLKRAWQYILDENIITLRSDFYLLSTINENVENGFYYNAGKIRSVPVNIGGSNYKPSIPIKSVIEEDINDLIGIEPSIENGIKLMLYIMRKQIFLDGNKRTAVIYANHYFISNKLGILLLNENMIDEFKKLLIKYYEGNDYNEILLFIKTNCFYKLKI